MIDSRRTRLLGKAALLFSNVMDSGETHERNLMANAPEARAYANMLDRIGLMHPRMLASAEIARLKWTDKEGEAVFLDLISESGGSCSVVGWAVLPTTRQPAPCVVLSYQNASGGPVVFRIANGLFSRADVAAARGNSSAEASGGSCRFDRSVVPPGDVLLMAWAFDANRSILYPLGTPQVLH
jgi:hypothetical protein